MEFSIVQLSDIESTSSRLDAEYYRPVFLDTEKKLKYSKWDYLENLTSSIKSFGAYSLCNQVEYKNTGVPFLRCKDIKDGLIDFSDVLYIDSDANKLLWKSEVLPETVLFTMSGTVGNSAIATTKAQYPINSNQDIAKIVTNGNLSPYYLSFFLQTTYGKRQVKRLPIGSVQQHIFLWQIEKIVIPLFNTDFQTKMESLFKSALSLKDKSHTTYQQAQDLLLTELGLNNWQSKHQLTFIRNYSDTVHAARIDAEYFQPKYDEIVGAIKDYKGGWDRLGNLCSTKRGSLISDKFYCSKLEGILYIRGADFSGGILSSEKGVYIKHYFEEQNETKVRTNEIVFSLIGSVGETALVASKYNGAYISNNTGKITCKTESLNPIFLQILLQSIIGKVYFEKFKTQTAQPKISDRDIHNFILPILPEEKQLQIQKKVTESFKLRKHSKQLLENAKRAVEMAIEGNEETALKWLNEANDKLL